MELEQVITQVLPTRYYFAYEKPFTEVVSHVIEPCDIHFKAKYEKKNLMVVMTEMLQNARVKGTKPGQHYGLFIYEADDCVVLGFQDESGFFRTDRAQEIYFGDIEKLVERSGEGEHTNGRGALIARSYASEVFIDAQSNTLFLKFTP